jgi:hypothetical protein
MKTSLKMTALLTFTLLAITLQPGQAKAGSRVYVGLDLGGIVAAFDTGPRYVHYRPPVVYERWHAWRPAPPPYPPPRYHSHRPPPRWYHDDYRRGHHRSHHPGRRHYRW